MSMSRRVRKEWGVKQKSAKKNRRDGKDMEKGGKEINVRKDQTCASA
jgi:hypothetical protein